MKTASVSLAALMSLVLLTGCAGLSPVEKAIEKGELSAVATALAKAPDINAPGGSGDPPLLYAVQKKNHDMVKLILEKGAKPDFLSKDGDTPLTLAAGEGDMESVRLLLDHGAGVNFYRKDGVGAFPMALVAKRPDIARLLLDRGFDLSHVDDNGTTALMHAANNGPLEMVELVLARGADVNQKSNYGHTALLYAAGHGDLAIAKLLVAKGADLGGVYTGSYGGITALGLAAEEGHPDMMRYLYDLGVEAGDSAETMLNEAASYEKIPHVDMVAWASKLIADRHRSAETLKRFMERPRPAAHAAAPGLTREDIASLLQAAKAAPVPAAAPAAAPSFVSDVDSPKYGGAQRPNDYAIVVGIEKYSSVPDAQFAARDAQAMRDHLAAMGYPERNIVLLLGDRATKTGIIKNLETWLPRNVNGQSNVFFFFSGHGSPDTKTGQAFLVPFDGDPQYLEDTGYPVRRLYEKLQALKVKQVFVALDSCFSGAGGRSILAKGTRPLVSKVDLGASGGANIVSFTASQSDEISGALEAQGHGLFTYYFLRGLNGAAAADSGGVTVKSLYDYVTPNVQDVAHRSNREQTPQLLNGASENAPLRLR